MELPIYQGINTKSLQRLFDNMSECYKPFWFQALIDKVMEGRQILSFEELVDEMIAGAWYPVLEYKLNLGPADTLEALVQVAQKATGLKSSEKREKIIAAVRASDDKEIRRKKLQLTLNVPYRLQAPFLHGVKGGAWNCSQTELAEKIADHDGLIYRFESISGLSSLIRVDDRWVSYIRANYDILSGWVRYNLILYLQRRNPNVPGISSKLEPPEKRNLDKVKKFWKSIIEIEPVHEIYGSFAITAKDMSIDHFVPWSYVANDELWNLSPTTKSINSSKSNRLPDWDSYYPRLRALQYHAYETVWKYPAVHDEFNKCLKEHVNSTDVQQKLYRRDLTRDEFFGNMEGILQPVYLAAQNMGFENWRFE